MDTGSLSIKWSDQIGEIAAALAKAQGAMANAAKDSANPFFHSKYADLASIMDACRGPLSANGIAFIQLPFTLESKEVVEMKFNRDTKQTEEVAVPYARVGVITRLIHSSGQFCEGMLDGWVRGDIQGIGSGITYLRRYTLAPMVGVAAADDDGNSANKPQDREAKPSPEALKTKAIQILSTGAERGDAGFAEAWKAISQEMKRLVSKEAPEIRARAQAVDKKAKEAEESVEREPGVEVE